MGLIAVDLMGGSTGVANNLAACAEFRSAKDLVLVGQREAVQGTASAQILAVNGATFLYAEDFLDGSESLSDVLRNRPNSSMAVCAKLLANNEVKAVVSSGDTKALLGLARSHVGTLPGLQRPAITKSFQGNTRQFYMLDLGANVNCSENMLTQFAKLGAALAYAGEGIPSIQSVRVALLNIGTERGKGTEQLNSVAATLGRDQGLDYVGFVEPTELFSGVADVIVCDGFSGNIMLKTLEGVASHIRQRLRGLVQGNEALSAFGRELDPERYNGALMAGLNGIVVKSHGSTGKLGFLSALNQANDYVGSGLTKVLADNL
ncbi:MAG: glycerol-3-phosphate acyltransferase PlsX [Candidatus Azotimanducaceae bacterium]|jgi:glycerol-3-phosphate acyltransferase PlsX|tara:strand:+ start:1230 stop:2186 length:957 start_codon:yes stop_codon:yes gene_type:complete